MTAATPPDDPAADPRPETSPADPAATPAADPAPSTPAAAPRAVDPRLARRRAITGALLLPMLFLTVFPLLFIGAFHSPTPRGVDVAIVGDARTTTPVVRQLAAGGEAFDPRVETSRAAAVEAVRTGEIRAAYVPRTAEAYTASAAGVQLAPVVTAAFERIAAGSDRELRTHDVVPLPKADGTGSSTIYLGVGAIVGGFLTGLLTGLIAPRMRTRTQLAVLLGMGLLVAGIETFYGWVLFDVFTGHALGAFGMLLALGLVAGTVTLAGMRLIGPGMLLVSLTLLVFAGVTGSGLGVQLDLAPPFYGVIHHLLPTASGLAALKSTIYFGGHGIGPQLLTMGVWLVAALGVVLLVRRGTDRRDESPLDEPDMATAVGATAAAGAAG
jgi:hypothetical protein